jgi:hypothetical protein
MPVCLLSMLIYTNENLGRVRVYLTSRPIFSVMIALKLIKAYLFLVFVLRIVQQYCSW